MKTLRGSASKKLGYGKIVVNTPEKNTKTDVQTFATSNRKQRRLKSQEFLPRCWRKNFL